MATDLQSPPETSTEPFEGIAMPGIGWSGYKTMLRLRGEKSRPRMIYLDGDLWLMSPVFSHDHTANRLNRFVDELTTGLGIRCVPSRSTTFRRRKKQAGVEGDATFYLVNATRLRGLANINLSIDPPPDLAIEAVNTHGASHALAVYRRLGVPEVWVSDSSGMAILALNANKRYIRVDSSVAFPFLSAAEIAEWIYRPFSNDETQWALDLRQWVATVLLSRYRDLDPNAHKTS